MNNEIVKIAKQRLGKMSYEETTYLVTLLTTLIETVPVIAAMGISFQRYLEMNRTVLDAMELAASVAKEKN